MLVDGQTTPSLIAASLVFGLLAFLLVWGLVRVVPGIRPLQQQERTPPAFVQIESHGDAVLAVQLGGRVAYLNRATREWFDLSEGDIPNLERMSRRVRPGELFLELCAAEGQARFSVNGKLVEGNSYSYNFPGGVPGMLVALRTVKSSLGVGGEQSTISGTALKTIAKFGEEINSGLSLDGVADAILKNVEALVAVDYLELKVMDVATGVLIPYRLGGGSGSSRMVSRVQDTQFGAYEKYILAEKRELLLEDARNASYVRFDPTGGQIAPMGSYLGFPLFVDELMVGILEVGAIPVNGYSNEDIEILRLVIGQTAIAIRNAVHYEAQEKLTAQLLGLTNLAQAVGGLQDLGDLFKSLVDGLSPIFNVGVLGFLLYDEQRRMLEAQEPFFGLSNQFVSIYKTMIRPSSQAEKRIFSQDTISTLNASQDAIWEELGLLEFSQAASMRDTVLIPLVSAGRFLGYLQLSNHNHTSESLEKEEMRLLKVVANQVASIIDNAMLVQQARQRNQRAEAMRRLASLVSSTATLDEILRFSVRESAQLLQAQFGAVFLVDQQEGVMRAHLESVFGADADEQLEPLARLDVKPTDFYMTVAGSQRAFTSGSLSKDRRILPVYRAFVRKLSLESCISVPLVVRGQGIGELMFGAQAQDLFNNFDLQTAAIIASQIAVAIENVRYAEQSRDKLRRKADQSTHVSRFAREFNATMDPSDLLRLVHDESVRISGADSGIVIILEDSGEKPQNFEVAMSFGSEVNSPLSQMQLDTLQRGAPLLLTSFDKYARPQDGVESVLLVPIEYQENIFGLIELRSSTSDCFDEIIVDILRTLGIQSAIAFGNAFRYRELVRRADALRRRADTLANISQTAQTLLVNQSLEKAIESIARGIQNATHFDVVLISLYDKETESLKRVAQVGLEAQLFAEMQAHQPPWEGLQQVMKAEFRVGNVFFIPFDRQPVFSADLQMVKIMSDRSVDAPNAWHPDDLLLIPVYDSHDAPLGLISVDSPQSGLRPDRTTIESLEIFSTQAALTIHSAMQLADFDREVERLRLEILRQKNLVGFSQRSLPTLLHNDLEHTLFISYLAQRGRHIRAGLQLTEAISRQIDSSSALMTLGQQIITSFDMSISIVAKETSEGPRILHMMGNLPRGVNPDAMFGQRNPLRSCLQTGETIISANLDEDEIWHDTPFLTTLKAKAFVCLPVVVNGKPIAAVLATDTEIMPALSNDDRQVYNQISRQISIILQNISLLSETRQRLEEVNLLLDFSRRLSGLKPSEILQSLMDSALRVVSPAHAGVVLMWDLNEELLVPKAASSYVDNDSILEIPYRLSEGLPGHVFVERQPHRVDEVNFASDYNLPAEHLLRYRKATGGRLPVSSMVVPIQTGDYAVGVVILDNFNTTAAFRADDEAILLSLTQQVALALENVRLVQATEERASQLQALNEVAATISSSLRREDLVDSLLGRLDSVIQFDTAILWLRGDGNTVVIADTRGYDDNEERKGLTANIEDGVLLKEIVNSGKAISVGDVRQDVRFPPSLLEIKNLSWLGVPLITKGEVIGLLVLEKVEANFYNNEQIQLATTFASQAAVALDNARLFNESMRRAAELDERSQRLALLNQFSSELSGSLNADQVLRLAANQLMKAVNADRALMVLLGAGNKAFLLSVLPEEGGQPAMQRSLPATQAFENLRESQGIYTADDVSRAAELASLSEILVGVASVMIVPVSSSQSLYAIVLETTERHMFSSTEIDLARTFSNQAGIALENADLYQSTVATAERLNIINEASYSISSSLDPEETYRSIHDAVSKLMPVDAFIIALVDPVANEIDGVYIVDLGQRIAGVRLAMGQGVSGRVIETGEPWFTSDSDTADSMGAITVGDGSPHSIIAVPMFSRGKVIGALSAQSYQFSAYSETDLQLLSTLANQATVAIQNGRLFSEAQQLAATMEQRVVERTAELEHEQRNTETLLRILTEVSSSLDLDRALTRTLALLNDSIGAEQGTIMLVHAEDNMLHFRAGYGYATDSSTSSGQVVPRSATTLKLKIGEGLAGWVVKNRQPVLVDDLYVDPRWIVSQSSQHHRSAVVAPLVVADDVIGAIMVFHRKQGYFTEDAMEMVQAIGSQVAISINNAQLYELIRDQAERLGVALRTQQMEASRQSAILEAVADGVLVTDAANVVSFVNASTEKVLGIAATQIEGRSLDNFVGLFGKNAQAWMHTVSQWSANPASYQRGETYAEQISLENGRVILVHLAPVIWQAEFLGTVSIFRDITHEVEVDRLKSEFVATVSHELRTPMTSIRGYVDVLLMGAAGALNDGQSHFLNIVKNNTERLNVLVNDLLDTSRIEAGRVTLSMQSVDLREVAEETVEELLRRSHDEGKPMAVALEADERLPYIIADPERIRQVVGNLMDNAYNYTSANGSITIRLHRVDNMVQVSVKDTGIGIPPEQQARVFERFYRGEDPLVLATPGTGLGLSIVVQLVEMHNGKIWMESEGVPGRGSTFSFTVPVEPGEE